MRGLYLENAEGRDSKTLAVQPCRKNGWHGNGGGGGALTVPRFAAQ